MEKIRASGGKKVNSKKLKEALKKEFGEKIKIKTTHTKHGKKNKVARRIWAEVKPEHFKKVVEFLFELQDFPHYSVSSGVDLGKEIEITNHFTLNYGKQNELILFNLKTSLNKKKPEMPTLTNLIPGAWVSEKEKQEFLGVNIKGIEKGRLFLDDSLPKGVFPWRKDSSGVGKNAVDLHSGDSVE